MTQAFRKMAAEADACMVTINTATILQGVITGE